MDGYDISLSHFYDGDQSHLQGTGMKSLFEALKNDPTASKLLESPPKDQSSYTQLQNSIVMILKGNE